MKQSWRAAYILMFLNTRWQLSCSASASGSFGASRNIPSGLATRVERPCWARDRVMVDAYAQV